MPLEGDVRPQHQIGTGVEHAPNREDEEAPILARREGPACERESPEREPNGGRIRPRGSIAAGSSAM